MVKELDYFAQLLKETDNEYASIVDEIEDSHSFTSTGSLSLNALLSGSIYGGAPGNTVTALAGEPSTGKTFYAIAIARKFLDDNPTGHVFYFESENAIFKATLANRGVDVKRVSLVPVGTVQEFRTQALKILNRHLDTDEASRPPMLFILDSLGNLSTDKEMNDIAEGKDTRDMTRAQLIRGAFRAITLKLGKANVPMIITNHVYDVIGSYIPMKKMGGGSGLEYAASQIIFLSKKKDSEKDGDGKSVVQGVIITAVLKKARLTIENKKVETYLNYQTGLDPYYGLLDLALKFGIWEKISTKIKLGSGNDEAPTEFASKIEANPQKYFTKEVLDKIDAACQDEFLYGRTNVAAAPTEAEETQKGKK